jgi:hypothetical protein
VSLYNYFLTNPFGPGARTLEWIYLGRTGGSTTDLDSERTYGADTSGTNCRIVALNNSIAEVWQLMAGTQPSDPTNGWVRPLDFGLSTNEKVWHRLFCFGTGGSGGGINFVTNETPNGVINSVNTAYSTLQPFRGIDLDVFLNGLRQRYNIDYTILTANVFHMTTAPVTGDTLIVDYIPL